MNLKSDSPFTYTQTLVATSFIRRSPCIRSLDALLTDSYIMFVEIKISKRFEHFFFI